MRHLFSYWEEVDRRLSAARTIALFLDFDGTLARLRPRPDEVFLDQGTHRSLCRLARSPRFRVWVISGRRRDDIRSRIKVPGICYLGIHGWEGRATAALDETTTLALAEVKHRIQDAFAISPTSTPEALANGDLWIEDKGASIAIHYRPLTEFANPRVLQILKGFVEPFRKTLRTAPAKNVLEIMPRAIHDKGVAVRQHMATIRNATVPIYVGDDLIDEPAFVALGYGITVRVGRIRQSKAKYRLTGVAEVRAFLTKLAAEFA